MAFRLLELGLLTLAMFIPMIAGGSNIAGTFTANICGLAAAFIVQKFLLENADLPLAVRLISLQVIASGTNLMGASQHWAIAAWGGFLLLVIILRAPFQAKT